MHSIEALLAMVMSDAVMFDGMSEDEYYRRGYHLNSEVLERDSGDEATIEFSLRLVKYRDGEGRERYRWVED